MSVLTVLSYGGGQDSTTLLYKYAFDKDFRKKYAPGRFLVIMADTGDEHAHTYTHVEFTKKFCESQGIEFIHITPDMGFHQGNWQNLRHFYHTKNAVGSKCFPKTCTDNLKLKPIYKFLEAWIEEEYSFLANRKKGIKEFAKIHGNINMLIGIAKGEEKRVKSRPEYVPKYTSKGNKRTPSYIYFVDIIYPLIDMGMDRQSCQAYMRSVNMPVPYPSNCIICPFMSNIELLWLYRNLPNDYKDWVNIEMNKIKANAYKGDLTKALDGKGQIVDNMGVWGKKLLPEILVQAQKKHGHMTDEELRDYKMNHGCVMSKY